MRVARGPGRRVNRSWILRRWNNQDKLVTAVLLVSLAGGIFSIVRGWGAELGPTVPALYLATSLITGLLVYREYHVRLSRKIFGSVLYALVITASVLLYLMWNRIDPDVLKATGISHFDLFGPAIGAAGAWLVWMLTLLWRPAEGLGRRKAG